MPDEDFFDLTAATLYIVATAAAAASGKLEFMFLANRIAEAASGKLEFMFLANRIAEAALSYLPEGVSSQRNQDHFYLHHHAVELLLCTGRH